METEKEKKEKNKLEGEKFEKFGFRQCKIKKTNSLYLLSFGEIPILNRIRDRLCKAGWLVKGERFHMTLGDVEEIEGQKEFKPLLKEINTSLEIGSLSEKLLAYFETLDWCLSLVCFTDLDKEPTKIVYQNNVKLNE